MKPLSRKHQKFVEEYLKCWNGSQAYMKVYPKAAYDSARANASKLLANANVVKEISERLSEAQMGADEALLLLADQARGDIAQLMEVTTMGFNMDMQVAKDKGLTKLIKKVKQKTTTYIAKSESQEDREVTELEVELYDAQSALVNILKMHGKYGLLSTGEPLDINGLDLMLGLIYGKRNNQS